MNISLRVNPSQFVRSGDTGWKIPNDGKRYFMVRHEIDLLGFTRHKENNTKDPIPAVAYKGTKKEPGWGTNTADGKDFTFVREPWQKFFYEFINAMSGGLLPEGEFIGYYYIKNNPGLPFHDYTPGSRKWIYSRMYQDAVWATDAGSFTLKCKDVVLGLNLHETKVWQYLSGRPCTGAVLQLMQDRGSVLRFKCLDSNGNPPDPYSLEPWRYYYCTEVHESGKVTRFHQYTSAFRANGWEYPIGTPSPLMAPEGWLEMNKNAVVELPPGTVWQPYLNR